MTAIPAARAAHLAVVLPPDTPDGSAAELVTAAARLAAGAGVQLDVIAGPAFAAPDALDAPSRWWRVVAALPRRLDSAALATWAAQAIATLADGLPRLVLWPAGVQAHEEAAARLAARRDAQALGKVTQLQLDAGGVQAARSSWGGRATLRLHSRAACTVACWRPAAGGEPGRADHAVVVAELDCAPDWPAAADAREEPAADRLRPLEGAAVVVAGGRGLGADGFAALEAIAARLDAALAGSLPSVDAGWVPVARQVGQSGKFVAPRSYLAVAISGTAQHLAGVATTSRIVAVNSDPGAPIFGVAAVGVVAEWQALLPALQRAIDDRIARRAAPAGLGGESAVTMRPWTSSGP